MHIKNKCIILQLKERYIIIISVTLVYISCQYSFILNDSILMQYIDLSVLHGSKYLTLHSHLVLSSLHIYSFRLSFLKNVFPTVFVYMHGWKSPLDRIFFPTMPALNNYCIYNLLIILFDIDIRCTHRLMVLGVLQPIFHPWSGLFSRYVLHCIVLFVNIVVLKHIIILHLHSWLPPGHEHRLQGA